MHVDDTPSVHTNEAVVVVPGEKIYQGSRKVKEVRKEKIAVDRANVPIQQEFAKPGWSVPSQVCESDMVWHKSFSICPSAMLCTEAKCPKNGLYEHENQAIDTRR